MAGRVVLEKRLGVATLADQSPEGVKRAQRDMIRQVREDMRQRGVGPNDYQLEGAVDDAVSTFVLRSLELDPMTRPLPFDDRGIV